MDHPSHIKFRGPIVIFSNATPLAPQFFPTRTTHPLPYDTIVWPRWESDLRGGEPRLVALQNDLFS